MNTFSRNLQLSALDDLHVRLGLVAVAGLSVLNRGDDLHALEDLAENDMLAIEPTGLGVSACYKVGNRKECMCMGRRGNGEELRSRLSTDGCSDRDNCLEWLFHHWVEGWRGGVWGVAFRGYSRSDNSGNEELRSVGVLSGVGHAQKSGASVLQLEVLIGELLAIDRLSAGSVALGEVSSLDHELLDDTVELGALVAVALLAGCQCATHASQKPWLGVEEGGGSSPEVLGGLGGGLAVKADHNAAEFFIAMLDVEVDLVIAVR